MLCSSTDKVCLLLNTAYRTDFRTSIKRNLFCCVSLFWQASIKNQNFNNRKTLRWLSLKKKKKVAVHGQTGWSYNLWAEFLFNRPLTFAPLVMTWVESVIMGFSDDECQSAVKIAALMPWDHHVWYSNGWLWELKYELLIIGRRRWGFKLSNAKAITGSYI